MVKENSRGNQATCTRDTTLMIVAMATVRCIGMMGRATSAIGKMVINMARVN